MLLDFGLRPRVRAAGTGLTVEVGAGDRVVAFRADLDALPIAEDNDAPYRSQHPGVMHACGHDAHVAILMGVAELLAEFRADLPGTVKLLFQPNEEGHEGRISGAQAMINDGALANPAPSEIGRAHV